MEVEYRVAHLLADALDITFLLCGPHAHAQDEQVEEDDAGQPRQVDIPEDVHDDLQVEQIGREETTRSPSMELGAHS